jgi:hypothetical protein
MPAATLQETGFAAALRLVKARSRSGALWVKADEVSGLLFFDCGSVYFGSIDGVYPTAADFAACGIDPTQLVAASDAPRAGDRFADALMNAGAPGRAVRQFAHDAIVGTIAALSGADRLSFDLVDRFHPYGPSFLFDVDDLIDECGLESAGHTADAPQAPTGRRTDTAIEVATDEEQRPFARRNGIAIRLARLAEG